ncbi:Uma2 family endonuclease [Sorangium sp. So ce448]|uniref:Uma2 family endonuclease n=1 Tax=Sorangium sp. So ce448 TaxID=3133314 RepID=UPI003F5DEAA6
MVQAAARSPAPASGRRMSLAEWAALPEDEPGELVDGLLVEEEVSGYVHEVVVGWLIHMLRAWITSRGGLVGGSDAKFAVKPQRGRKPDVTVFFPGSRRPPARGLVRIPPDIAVEVVSPTPSDGRRDRVEKLREYAAFGVRWYWIVDPQLRSIEVLELGADGRYTHALDATDGSIDVPGCEGLRLELDALWGEVEQLGAEEGGAPEEDEESSPR